MQVTTIGLDIAKNMFQVHGIDAAEKVVVRKQLRRSQVLEFRRFIGHRPEARRPSTSPSGPLRQMPQRKPIPGELRKS